MDFIGLLIAAVLLVWSGLRFLGEGIVGIIRALLGIFSIVIPDFIVEIVTILAFLGFILKYGKHISKVILIILLLLFASVLFGALLGG